MPRQHVFRPRNIPCPFKESKGCSRLFADHSGATRHAKAVHRIPAREAAAVQPTPGPSIPLPPPSSGSPPPDDKNYMDIDGDLDGVSSPQSPMLNSQAGDHEEREGPVPQMEGRVLYHPLLNARPCDKDGKFLPEQTAPSPPPLRARSDYNPFESRIQFEVGDFLYRQVQMSGKKIDQLMQLWSCTLPEDVDPPFASAAHLYDTLDSIPLGDVRWEDFSVTYNGRLPEGPLPPWMIREYDVLFRNPVDIVRGLLANPDFHGSVDYIPKQVFTKAGKCQLKDFMSGDWVWLQADKIAKDPTMHGAMFCPIIMGSDKTTVSVATGQNEYYPLYITIGNVSNTLRRSRRNAIILLGFLSIPKTDRQYSNDAQFRKFHRQLFHTSLRHILQPLAQYMTSYVVMRCSDGHFRRVVFGLGPYVADYPEQVLLSCVVQGWCARCLARPENLDTGQAPRRSHEHTAALLEINSLRKLWDDYGIVGDLIPFTAYFPRADIHELLSPDLLHQVIKGTFKDHLVDWVEQYLVNMHGRAGADVILADIDRRIAVAPPFPGLRRFPEGRGFKQWTGDDSKALMKVYLPAIEGHVPPQMVRALAAFLEFCYLVRRDVIDEDTLDQIDDALIRFHHDREIFIQTGVRMDGISLPRQHSLKHYRRLIQLFASPNGLCSSMMEARHITAVKQPYRRSSRNGALGQIVKTNQRLDKLAAIRVDFAMRGMLDGACPRLSQFIQAVDEIEDVPAWSSDSESSDDEQAPPAVQRPVIPRPPTAAAAQPDPNEDDDEDDDGDGESCDLMAEVFLATTPIRGYPKGVNDLALAINVPQLSDLVRYFLYDQLSPNAPSSGREAGLQACPPFSANITVFPSAVAVYYAPSDRSGPQGMHRERIRSVASWRGGPARRDCVFVEKASASDEPGFRSLFIARVHLFFSFKFQGILYPCALISGFTPSDEEPDSDTGMWVVTPDVDAHGQPEYDIIHVHSILRAAHLIGVSHSDFLPRAIGPENSLDVFRAFYVNKFADHHAHEIAF